METPVTMTSTEMSIIPHIFRRALLVLGTLSEHPRDLLCKVLLFTKPSLCSERICSHLRQSSSLFTVLTLSAHSIRVSACPYRNLFIYTEEKPLDISSTYCS